MQPTGEDTRLKNTDTLKPQTENIVSDGVAEATTVPAAAGVGYVRTDAAPFVSGEAAKKPPRTIEISKKAVVTAVAIVLVLVIFAIVLTQVLPRGAYDRIPDANGNEQIVPDSYREDPSLDTLKWWQAVFAPFLVLDPSMDGSLMVWALIALLLVIGAVFTALDHTGVLVYMVANLAAFGVIASVEQHSGGKVGMDDYNGLYRTNPKLAITMTLALFSLGGIPPFAGFFSKFFIFAAAFEEGFHVLVFIALLNTIISLYYYLLVVKAMFINPNDAPIASFRSDSSTRISLVLCLAGVLVLGIASTVFDSINLFTFGL